MYQNWVRQDNVDKEDWCWVLIVSRTNCQGWAGWWDAVRHSDGWNWWHRCHPPVTVIRNFLPLLPPTPQAWAIWFWFVLFNIYNQEKQSYERPQPASCIDDIAKVRKDKFALLWGESQLCLPYVCWYKPAWKAWGCESCLTSLPLLTEPHWVLLGPGFTDHTVPNLAILGLD